MSDSHWIIGLLFLLLIAAFYISDQLKHITALLADISDHLEPEPEDDMPPTV